MSRFLCSSRARVALWRVAIWGALAVNVGVLVATSLPPEEVSGRASWPELAAERTEVRFSVEYELLRPVERSDDFLRWQWETSSARRSALTLYRLSAPDQPLAEATPLGPLVVWERTEACARPRIVAEIVLPEPLREGRHQEHFALVADRTVGWGAGSFEVGTSYGYAEMPAADPPELSVQALRVR